jgi:hypothetical protein
VKLACLVLTLAVLTASSAARADDGAEAKRRGDDALVAGRAREALAAYEEAWAANPDPALYFNRGRAYLALGEYPAALDQLEAFSREASPELRAKVPGLEKLLREVQGKVSTIAITSNVEGATVALDGARLGTTPIAHGVRVAAGTGKLLVVKDGYLPFERVIALPGGGLATVDATLASRTTSGILAVTSRVAGAVVTVDGKSVGNVPSEIVVASGPHQVEVSLAGHRTASSSVVVAAGSRRDVTLDPERESILGAWWFWTGVGVVAAGVTITIVALTTDKDAGSGSFNPGRISSGLRF